MVKYVTIVCERLIFMFFLEKLDLRFSTETISHLSWDSLSENLKSIFQEQTRKSNHSQTIVTDLTIQTIVTYSTILTIVSDSLRVAWNASVDSAKCKSKLR